MCIRTSRVNDDDADLVCVKRIFLLLLKHSFQIANEIVLYVLWFLFSLLVTMAPTECTSRGSILNLVRWKRKKKNYRPKDKCLARTILACKLDRIHSRKTNEKCMMSLAFLWTANIASAPIGLSLSLQVFPNCIYEI